MVWTAELERLAGDAGAAVSSAFGDVTITVPATDWVRHAHSLAGQCFARHSSTGCRPSTKARTVSPSSVISTIPVRITTSWRGRHCCQARNQIGSVTSVFRGAAWHERETAEMFGIHFVGHPHPERLLLSDEFDGHPLRKRLCAHRAGIEVLARRERAGRVG